MHTLLRGLAALLAIATVSAAHADVRYVDGDQVFPGGDGTSWATPYKYLRDALDEAAQPGSSVTEIRVAGGTYLPAQSVAEPFGVDRELSFDLVAGVTIAGAYAGLGAADPDLRDIVLFETVLSGDLLGDDLPDFGARDDNAIHVVSLVSSAAPDAGDVAVIDGVTVERGYAVHPSITTARSTGGGIYAVGGQLNLVDVTIRENGALMRGGGLAVIGGSCTVGGSTIIGNRVGSNVFSLGGGVYADGVLNISGSVIAGNVALQGSGGGVCANVTTVTITGSIIEFNEARIEGSSTARGGGIFANGCQIMLSGDTVRDNIAESSGGGIYSFDCEGSISGCTITGNHGAESGGGLWVVSGSPAGGETVIEFCTLSGNSTTGAGGGAYLDRAVAGSRMRDSFVFSNSAGRGGGVYAAGANGVPLVEGCTISGNTAVTDGGGAYVMGEALILGGTLQGNTADRGGGACVNGRADVVGLDDISITNNTATTDGGGVWLMGGTVFDCLLASNVAGEEGGGGFIEPREDPGPIEQRPTFDFCFFNNNTAPRGGGGASAIQVETLPDGTRFAGVFTGCSFFDNVADFGGGFHGQADLVSCSFVNNEASAAGGGMYRRGHISSYTRTLTTECTFGGNSAPLGGGGYVRDRFQITGSTIESNSAELGAGLYFPGGKNFGWVLGSLICDNSASVEGGGLWLGLGANPRLTGCNIDNNSAPAGGGMYCTSARPILHRCTFDDNAGNNGAAVRAISGLLNITSSSFTLNSGDVGGGLLLDGGPHRLTSCVIANNTAEFQGAGVVVDSGRTKLVNCTVIAHETLEGTAVLRTNGTGRLECWNGIVHNPIAKAEIVVEPGSMFVAGFSNVNGGWPGDGNIDQLPVFADRNGPDGDPETWEDNDLRLVATSPGIDAGINQALPAGVDTDLAGDPRFVDDPATPDTGFGPAPLVDMGAFEFQPAGCAADLTGDGTVNVLDLLEVLAAFGTPAGDVTGDGLTDVLDVLAVLAAWGDC